MPGSNHPVKLNTFTTFGDLLRYLRRRADLTQTELSIAVGYSHAQISRLERNHRLPDPLTLAARFIPALGLENEPDIVARLLALATPSEAQRTSPAPASPTHNLPLEVSRFFGRESEITQLTEHLAQHRLVTLIGAGGVGKTRLSLQVARQVLGEFPDGVWFIELADLNDPALFSQSLAATLGVRELPGTPILTLVSEFLRARRLLLILDNCEHLIQACAKLADTLLHSALDVRILATSREPFGIPGEVPFRVPSLSTPNPHDHLSIETLGQYDAIRLFVERGGAVLPGFRVTQQNMLALAQVCYQLDGIPLAIELAAARAQILRIEQIAARLDDRFRLLTGGSRASIPRHQTLRALVDWSYDLLSEPERVLLARLSVFAGGWTLAAAEQVAGEAPVSAAAPGNLYSSTLSAAAILDLLAQLINKSLVISKRVQGQETRYQLQETIRQYALSKLAASEETDAVRQRHLLYYLALAEANEPSDQAWHDRIQLELDNLRAALTWSQKTADGAEPGLRLAHAIGDFCFVRGYWSEGQAWLEAALAHPMASRYPRARARALQQLGDMAGLQGDYATAETQMAHSLRIFQELGDRPQIAWVLDRLGRTAREQGNTVSARLQLEESLALYRELGDTLGIAWASVTLSEVLVMQEDAALATARVQEGLSLFTQLGEKFGMGWALNHLGHIDQIQGEYDHALLWHAESLRCFREFGERNMGVAWADQSLGEIALAQGHAERALAHLTEGLILFREFGDRSGMAWCLAGLAATAALGEEPQRAAWLWGAAEAARQAIGSREAPAARATHQRLMTAAREQMGEVAFMAAQAQGQTASPEQAIVRALRSDE